VSIGLLGIPWAVWGGLCLLVAAIYTVVWPRPKQPASARLAWRQPILRWMHAVVWLALVGSCFLRSTDWQGAPDGANALALLAASFYALFLATLVADRKLTR
jgi:hypothetical protein